MMQESARVFREERDKAFANGSVIGILPCGRSENEYIEILIRTHLLGGSTGDDSKNGMDPLSRNRINAWTCDAVVALPGGGGTRAEIKIAAQYKTPLILFGWPLGILVGLNIAVSSICAEEATDPAVVQLFILANTTSTHTPGLPHRIAPWP